MKENLEQFYFIVSSLMLTVSTIVALVALFFSNRKLLKQLQQNSDLHKKQAQETFFSEYTKRYQDIILGMPVEENHPKWLKYVQLYFDLCSEEFHLHKKGLIDEYVWTLWVEGMQVTMKQKSLRLAWQNHLGVLYTDPDFISFMHNTIINGTN